MSCIAGTQCPFNSAGSLFPYVWSLRLNKLELYVNLGAVATTDLSSNGVRIQGLSVA